MKKLLISSVVAVSSSFAVAACAQTGATNPSVNNMPHHNMMQQQGQMGMQGMMSQLNLTGEQQNKMRAIMQSNQGDYAQKRNEIMEVLTPEQRQQMQRMNQGAFHHGGRMMQQGGMHHNGMMQQRPMMNQSQNGQINQGGRMDMSQ